MRAATLFLCISLAACTQFPDLDGTVGADVEDADYPALVPLERLNAAAAPVIADPILTTETLQARVAALRARAARLQRRAIVDAATRRRLQERLG